MNNKKKISLLVGLVLLTVASFSQNCQLLEDTLYYVEIDIRNPSRHPIIMSGVGKEYNSTIFTVTNVDTFLSTFYSNYYYVPDLYFNYKNFIDLCLETVNVNVSNEYDENNGSIIMQSLYENSINDTIYLDSGETVFICITKLISNFWVVDKKFAGVSTNSNEINVHEIKEIQQVYMPFEIHLISLPVISID